MKSRKRARPARGMAGLILGLMVAVSGLASVLPVAAEEFFPPGEGGFFIPAPKPPGGETLEPEAVPKPRYTWTVALSIGGTWPVGNTWQGPPEI